MTEAKTAPASAKPDAKAAEPSINFDLAPERNTVQKDGKLYEVQRLDDFGIAKQQQLDRDGREFSRLWTGDDELTDAQQKRLKMLLERIFADLLDAPKTAKAKFRDAEKAKLVLDFSLAPLREVLAAQMAAAMQQNSTSEARDGEPTTAT